jgi:hypothetical protein
MWVLTALRSGPQRVPRLLDDVRSLDGPMGHGAPLGGFFVVVALGLLRESTRAAST